MGFIELLILAVGLSMDAFAVSVCKGLCMRKIDWVYAFAIAFAFGLFQALMPVIGWLLGSSFASYIEPVDHWIAFIMLGAIGAKMIWDGLHGDADPDEGEDCDANEAQTRGLTFPRVRELVMLAIATSIDALVVGVSLAFIGVNIAFAAVVIGVTTFILSFAGIGIGRVFGARFEEGASIIGGIILILIGLKTLLEHLGIIAL